MLKSLLQYCLRVLSKKILNKYKPDIIGITGSVGKTSAKEAIATVLQSKFAVRRSTKNYNNEIGVPLSIIGVEKTPGRSILGWLAVIFKAKKLIFLRDKNYPKILVLEMGADKPGDIEYLTNFAPCKVGVLTLISHAHTEFFKTIKKIAQEKRIIISHLRQDGFAVLNFDNELIMQNANATKGEVITYGFKEGADLRATDVNILKNEQTGWPTGLNFKVLYKGNVVPVYLPGVIAKSAISAALSGLAVGTVFGVNLVDGAQALGGLESLPGRMRLIAGIKNTLIIDDTYNSSPEGARAAVETLAQVAIKDGAERYAALGDMLELGPETENAHRELGFKVAELGIDNLITVGEAAKYIAQAAKEAGLDEHRISSFATSGEAGRFLQEKLKPGDVVLAKGSQGGRMEKLVKEVMAEPLQAAKLLARQGKEWE
ncbi:MAG: UDP-N-acetylmuramoyl-tripeptide--D-alanyl-D-alanine ligase [Parcubacteria group bacterium Gr01-1014_13]|nr:MAG: UDP-N-acetylmuramoyl-tripeptide--D-alanyl-D-alanine ligase [Parcubacteria group bacterium Gr01-1014_13]